MRTRRLRIAVGAVALAVSMAGFWSGGAANAQVTTCPSNTRPWTESMIINPFQETTFTDGRNPVDLGNSCRYTGTVTLRNGSGIVDQFTDTRTFRKSELAPNGAILKPTFVS